MVHSDLELFAEEIGPKDPVCIAGGRTHWEVGGLPDPSAREVRAPTGIVQILPDEMMVRVRAGTSLQEFVTALENKGQMIPIDLDEQSNSTIGGALSIGWSSFRRLRWGQVRDLVLEIRYVSAMGKLIKAGAPVVKNVSGFDLPKVFVGSLGTLGCLAEVVLRTYPKPHAAKWIVVEDDPYEVRKHLFRPSSLLWNGIQTWVLLEGSPGEIQAELVGLRERFTEVDGPPLLPQGKRVSLRPSAIKQYVASLPPSSYLAEIGVGLVHLDQSLSSATSVSGFGQDTSSSTEVTSLASGSVAGSSEAASAISLHKRLKDLFDPTGRLNPGRSVI